MAETAASIRAEFAENTFVVRPPLRLKFPVARAQELMKKTLSSVLGGEDVKYSGELSKAAADAIRNKLASLGYPRYKIMVHVIVGENKGQGVRVATRCLWDSATDAYAVETFKTDTLYAIATAYAVYLP